MFAADLDSDAGVKQLHAALTGREGVLVGGIVNLLSIASTSPASAAPADPADATRQTTAQFRLLRELLPDLIAAQEETGGWLMNVTAIDGAFGCRGDATAASHFSACGSLGLFKSLSREQPKLCVRNVDLAPELTADDLVEQTAERLLAEFRSADPTPEVGLTEHARLRLAIREVATDAVEARPLTLSSDSVVMVTGGAYGVTADAARTLARQTRTRLILVGRSPLPDGEPAVLQSLDVAGLRKHLIEQSRAAGERVMPADLERKLQRLLRDRQIRATLDDLRAAGSVVEYHAVDVRDAAAFGRLIDDVYRRHGRLDGVVHGAGVIEDKLMADKSPESFARVFGTKVESALVLARHLQPESLQFLAYFSSVSGRLGNLGQSDYSAANEVLNKCAAAVQGRWFDGRPWNGRAVALNWGPWDAGMISDELRRLYASRGIGLIPLDEGVQAFADELQTAGPAEVVLASWPAEMVDALQGGFLTA